MSTKEKSQKPKKPAKPSKPLNSIKLDPDVHKDLEEGKEAEFGTITPEEKEILAGIREAEKIRSACAQEVDKVLNKYNCILTLDVKSPYGNPDIIVSLRR